MRVLKKYIALYFAFFRASLTADLEFRMNFTTKIVTDIFWYAAQIASFEVIFNFTGTIGDWNRADVRVFLGVLFVIDGLYMVIFSSSLDAFSDSVRKGNLDLLLTKPVNSQFMISCQRASPAHVGNVLMAVGWLVWALSQHENVSWWRLLWLLLTIPGGALIFYSLRFFFSAMAVVFARAENISYLWYHIYKLGLRPDTIYVPWLNYLVLSFLPVGLIASVPARLVLGTAQSWLALWVVFVGGLCLFLSNRFWELTLRKYASASS